MILLIIILKLIYLLIPAAFANMTPPMIRPFLSRLALSPVDGGLTFRGKAIFGSHKTWGGSLFGILAGILAAYLQHLLDPSFGILALVDYSQWSMIGFLMGVGAIVGDLVKSFFKRQLNFKPGQLWIPFDEIDFVLGALLFLSPIYFPGWINATIILLISFIGHILINLLGFYLKIRKRNEIVGLKYGQFAEEIVNKEGRLIAGSIFIVVSVLLNKSYGIEFYKTAIFCLFILNLVFDYLRAGLRITIPMYSRWGKISFEKESIHPITFMLIGLIFALQISNFRLAMAGLAMYVYGDSAAAILGKGFGKVRLFMKKTLEGSIAMFVFSMIGAAVFVDNLTLLFSLSFLASVLELFLLKLPDALIIPLVIALSGKCLGGGIK